MNEYMTLRTPDLLVALGDSEGLDIVIALFGQESTVKQLAAATDLPQPTVTRRLAALERAGVVRRQRRKKPWELSSPAPLAALLTTASELAEVLLASDTGEERSFREAVREAIGE